MIDFSKKHLFEVEQGKFNRFIKKKLETKTEYTQNTQFSEGDEEPAMDMSMLVGGDSYEFGTEGTWNEGLGGSWTGSEPGDKSGVTSAMDWQKENWFKTVVMSPLYLVNYVFKDLMKDRPQREEWEHILTALNKINVVSGSVALLVMLLGLNSPFTPSTQLVVSVVSFLGTSYALKKFYNTGLFAKKGEEGAEPAEDSEFEGEEGGEVNFETMNFSPTDGLDLNFGLQEAQEDEYEEEEEEEYTDNTYVIDSSPINIQSTDEFNRTLLEVYGEGNRNVGREINDRISLLQSFSSYIITNDRNFGKFRVPKERNVEYQNIAYAIFKGLVALKSEFETDDTKMTVLSIKGNPLFYKVEVILPSYFKADMIKRRLDAFEDMLKKSDADKEVSVLVNSYQGRFIFKLMRFDSKTLVSMGDILRFKGDDKGNGTALEQYADQKKGLPILMGLQDNETPYVIDFEKNTSGTIVGGSGSGKSWFTFSLMWNFILANSYDQVQFIIMDAKNASFWKAFARMPHVLGLHYDKDTFLQVLTEVEDERARRQEMLEEYGAEDFRGLRAKMREQGDHEGLKNAPLLVVIMDEITATMEYYKGLDDSKETYNAVRGIMTQITAQGRSAGVRLFTIGQRSIDTSVPKGVMSNSSFKFCMKLDNENDIKPMFGDEAMKEKKADMVGMGIASTFDYKTRTMIKTLTLGGKNDDQMLTLIRVVAFDWLRRAHGNVDLTKPPKGMNLDFSFNRPQLLEKSIREMKEGRILSPMMVNEEYALDLENMGVRTRLAPVELGKDEAFVSDNKIVLQKDIETSFIEDMSKPKFPAFEEPVVMPKLVEKEENNWIEESTKNEKKEIDFLDEPDEVGSSELIEEKGDKEEVKKTTISDFISMDDLISAMPVPAPVVKKEEQVSDVPVDMLEEPIPHEGLEGVNGETPNRSVEVPVGEKEGSIDFSIAFDSSKEIETKKSNLQEILDLEVRKERDNKGGGSEPIFPDWGNLNGESTGVDTKIGDTVGDSDGDTAGDNFRIDSDKGEKAPKMPLHEEKEGNGLDNHQPSDTITEDSFSGTEYADDEDDIFGEEENELSPQENEAVGISVADVAIEEKPVEKTQPQETEKSSSGEETHFVWGDIANEEVKEAVTVPADTEMTHVNKEKQDTGKSESINRKPVGAVTIAYESPKVVRKEEPRETVEQYILTYGEKVDMFTYRMEKAEVKNVYTQKKIDQALGMLLIMEEGAYYTAEK
ncbi:hypothetical protein CN495_08090 [Bacillus thuringiensis]|uniref:FtsK domain-containing protein n=1 Tax=Bacillus thuringiensis TaxID=1428 RepID=A0ABD6S792_BACTU|nr:FtsK/SpoIIIE domain-containing protein [Bacillus thuringiensis]PER55703.1 hypothetical protein CN495_08090 [Bacillus thuringiensis]